MIDYATTSEVRELLIKEGFPTESINLADSDYAIPTEEAIKNFGRRYGDFLKDAGLGTWLEEIWDCDDFALTAKALADIDNALWKKRSLNNSAIGFGMVWVMTTDGGHAINVALARDENRNLRLRYLEPQVQSTEKPLGETFVWLQEKSRDYFVSPLWCYF